MRSGIRIFKENGIGARGNVLPLSDFVLYRDIENRETVFEMGEYFVGEAEKMLSEEIPMLPLSLFRDFFITGVRSRFEQPHHKRRRMLFYMTLAEDYERKGRFTEKIADVLWAIMEESGWMLPAHMKSSKIDPNTTVPEVISDGDMPGLDLYAANCCATVAFTVYLLSRELDKISPVICKKAKSLIYRRGIRPFTEEFFGWAGEDGAKCNNWVTNITANVLFASALCSEDTEERERVLERAMRYLDNYTESSPGDGACDEGPGYWSGAAGNLFDCLELIDDMTGGKITVYDHPLVRKMGEYLVDVNIDGKYFLNFSDARPQLEQPGKMIIRYGEKCASEKLKLFGKRIAASNPIKQNYFFAMGYRVYKDCKTPAVKEWEPVKTEVARWFPDCKIAIFREFSDTSKGFYIAVKGGHNKESHNHKDVGCIVIYKDGKPVIIDPSHGSYDNGFFGPSRYKRWYMKSTYHSVPTPNGYEEEAGTPAYSSSEEVFSEEGKWVSLQLKGAFSEAAGVESIQRKCSLSDGKITVSDSVILKESGDIKFNYLSIDEPKQLGGGRLLLAEGCIFECVSEGLSLSVERVENKNLPYEDLNFKALWGRDALWLITLTAKDKEARAEVIFSKE